MAQQMEAAIGLILQARGLLEQEPDSPEMSDARQHLSAAFNRLRSLKEKGNWQEIQAGTHD